MAYTGTPGTATADQRRDAVFLTIGDTDPADQQLTNAEVDHYLLEATDDILLASIAAAEALQAKYARQVDNTILKTSVSASQRSRAYQALVDRLRIRLANGAAPLFGGQSLAEIERLRNLTDVPQPTFRNGQDDPPGVRPNSWSSPSGWL